MTKKNTAFKPDNFSGQFLLKDPLGQKWTFYLFLGRIVTQIMFDVAALSSKNSNEGNLISVCFKELLAVAQDLQASAGQLKVS